MKTRKIGLTLRFGDGTVLWSSPRLHAAWLERAPGQIIHPALKQPCAGRA